MLSLNVAKCPTLVQILHAAQDLVDEPGSNPEYERGIVELIVSVFGVEDGDTAKAVVRGLLFWPDM